MFNELALSTVMALLAVSIHGFGLLGLGRALEVYEIRAGRSYVEGPLWGHVLTSLVSNAISVLVIILVALVMGFRSSAGILSWLAVAGILALFTLALTWIAVIAGQCEHAAVFCAEC